MRVKFDWRITHNNLYQSLKLSRNRTSSVIYAGNLQQATKKTKGEKNVVAFINERLTNIHAAISDLVVWVDDMDRIMSESSTSDQLGGKKCKEKKRDLITFGKWEASREPRHPIHLN